MRRHSPERVVEIVNFLAVLVRLANVELDELEELLIEGGGVRRPRLW